MKHSRPRTCGTKGVTRPPGCGFFVVVVACLTLACPAWSTEPPRYAPAEGATFLVESHITGGDARIPHGTTRLEQHVVSSPDGLVWEAAVTMTYEEGPEANKLNADGMRDYLAAHSTNRRIAYRAFLEVEQTGTEFMPVVAKPDGSFVGMNTAWLFRTILDCPWTEFGRFFPFGRTTTLSMNCTRQSWYFNKPSPQKLTVLVSIVDGGEAVAHTPAGDLPVRRIRVTRSDDSGREDKDEMLFSEQLGRSLQTDRETRQTLGAGQPPLTYSTHVLATAVR